MLWGALIMVFGIFFAFFGNKFVNVVIFLAGAVVSFVASLWAVFFLLDKFEVKQTDVIDWLTLVGCALLGVGVGYLLKRFRKIGFGLLAGWGGVFLGLMLTTTFFITETWLYWLIIVGCAVGLCVLTMFVETHVIIMLTSFVGSYAIVRGISLYTGGFPSEIELHNMVEEGSLEWKNFDKIFYAYLGGIVVLTLLSAYYQFKNSKGTADSHPYHKGK